MILACLTASNPIATFRSRLKTNVDTLFLGEMSHERAPKTLSLEELLGRVRPNRPAVIKARSLALVRVETADDPSPEAAKSAEPEAPVEFETVSMRQMPELAPARSGAGSASETPAAPKARRVSSRFGVGRGRGRRSHAGTLLIRSRQRPIASSSSRSRARFQPRRAAAPAGAISSDAVSSPEAASVPTPCRQPAPPTLRAEPTERRAKLREPKPKAASQRSRRVSPRRRRDPRRNPRPRQARLERRKWLPPRRRAARRPRSGRQRRAADRSRRAGVAPPKRRKSCGSANRGSQRANGVAWIPVDERAGCDRTVRCGPTGFHRASPRGERYLVTLRFRPQRSAGVPVKV